MNKVKKSRKPIWDTILFFASAFIVAAGLMAAAKEPTFFSVGGWVTAIVWLLIARFWSAIAMVYKDSFLALFNGLYNAPSEDLKNNKKDIFAGFDKIAKDESEKNNNDK